MNKQIGLAIVVGVVVGISIASLRSPAPANAQKPDKAVSWEYKAVALVPNDADGHTKQVNKLASDGWEYVGLLTLNVRDREPSLSTVLFKRPKP